MMSKILYVGAGLHTEIIKNFPTVKKFILVDSRPRTEFGYEYYFRPFYRPYFFEELISKLRDYELKENVKLTNNYEEINREHLDPTLLHFIKEKIELKYFISTGIPCDLYNEIFVNELRDCDTLLISGHDPNSRIMDYIKKPFHFIGYSSTYFPKNLESFEEDEYNSAIKYILENPDKVKSYTYVDYNTGTNKTVYNYEDFYEQFKKFK